MKNKLLVCVFAMAIAAFAFTSCETKSNVTDVCSDLIKESMHKSARSLVQLDGQKLTIYEYEFLGGVDDNRLAYRTIAFGNGVNNPKNVDTLTYEYGEWGEANTSFSLLVTPPAGAPYTLIYSGNSFITPDGLTIGGEGTDNMARVEKWEKTIASFPNTDWEAYFEGDYVMDSIWEDSIRKYYDPKTFQIITDTIKVFKGKMDTLNADTTCSFFIALNRNASFDNTGRFYSKSIRSKYNRATKEVDTISVIVKEYDCNWFFTDVASDSKFTVQLQSTTAGVDGDKLSISKYKVDSLGVAEEFLQGGLTFKRPTVVPVP